MNYYQKIAKIFLGEEEENFYDWVQTFEPLDQVEIIRQAKQILGHVSEMAGHPENMEKQLQELEISLEAYQETILTELLVKQELDVTFEPRKTIEEMKAYIEDARNFIKHCILTNAENAAEMRELAKTLIQKEKDNGTYNPENWKEIL